MVKPLKKWLVLFLLAGILSVPVGNAPVAQSLAGERFKICFTAADNADSTTQCTTVTIVGRCTIYTADVNADDKVDLLDYDLVTAAGVYRTISNQTRPEDINNDHIVDDADVECVVRFIGSAPS